MSPKSVFIVLILFSQVGCSAKFGKILTASVIGGAVGAGTGYTVLHHGRNKQYQVQNTIISASVLAAVFGLATWYHFSALDDQRVELAGKFSRGTYLDRDVDKGGRLQGLTGISLGKQSIKLDDETRWVLPEFQKRLRPPERNDNEIIATHHSWEIVRPGLFLTRDQDPDLFKEEEKK